MITSCRISALTKQTETASDRASDDRWHGATGSAGALRSATSYDGRKAATAADSATRHHTDDGRSVEAQPGSSQLLPVRLDGEPVTDPVFALPLPLTFQPWERVVAAYLAARVAQ
jgi:hypothetical protein